MWKESVIRKVKCNVEAYYGRKMIGGTSLRVLSNLLERELPYKPQPSDGYEGKCKCGAMFLDRLTNYCGNCGQRLDWSEKD